MHEIAKPKTLRLANGKVILDILRASEEISIAEISAKAVLSKTTITKIINQFLDKGLAVSVGKGSSTGEGGKKPALYRFNERGGFVLCYHIFTDELYSVTTDLRFSFLSEVRVPISETETAGGIIDKIAASYQRHVEQGLDAEKLIGIAVGAHGITNFRDGVVVSSPHFPLWGDNLRLGDMLREKLAYGGPVYIDNQIRFQVFAEKVSGAAKDKKNIIVVEGGVGLVAGVIVKNEIKRGVHYLAGEIGHMIINPYEEERCACGGRGCFETMVSVRRILRLIEERRARFPASLLFRSGGMNGAPMQKVFGAADGGDPLACEVVDDVSKWFAIGLSNLILTYDPEIIILQGVYGKSGRYFMDRLRDQVNDVSLLHIKKNVRIDCSRFGGEAGIFGAAAYVVSEHFK